MHTTLPVACLFFVLPLPLVTLKLHFWFVFVCSWFDAKDSLECKGLRGAGVCSPPATDGPPASTSGEGDGAESGGIPSMLGQDYPHFVDIIRQEV